MLQIIQIYFLFIKKKIKNLKNRFGSMKPLN